METFGDKNKDELPKESDELFASSSNSFVAELFAPAGGESSWSSTLLSVLLLLPALTVINHIRFQSFAWCWRLTIF